MLMPIAGSRHEPSTSNSLTTRHGTLAEVTQDFQVEYIQRAIDVCEGNMTDAAARLGLHRSNLYRKMKQLGMPAS
jgi:Nif-specific regulatory protein